MLFAELNRSKCKTYLIACEKTQRAAIIDPIRERVDRYLAVLAYRGLTLDFAIDTHTHADHLSGARDLHDLTGAKVVMHRRAPAPNVDVHVKEGDIIPIGDFQLNVLATPGHTPDGMSLFVIDRVFTGDTLLIHGTGRADFAGGDAGIQYDSITNKLFTLPDSTLVFPAHDYRGHTSSTIGEEKRSNPRLTRKTRDEYVALMASLNLALPDKIQEVLQPNQSAVDDERVHFPDFAQLNRVKSLDASELAEQVRGGSPPVVLDVREPDEYFGELGHISSSVLIPLKELGERYSEIEAAKDRRVVVVCRAGVRSATAAAMLTALGFEHVYNLKGGMLDWNDAGLPIER
jgi:glyoxylase-like metal-dependent hydrolase (beta-lactamase superfamily II)/rhodanese-related sulfurtransferase